MLLSDRSHLYLARSESHCYHLVSRQPLSKDVFEGTALFLSLKAPWTLGSRDVRNNLRQKVGAGRQESFL